MEQQKIRQQHEWGYIRVASALPQIKVGNVEHNKNEIITLYKEASEAKCDVVLFPELTLLGYTAADLFNQTLPYEKISQALIKLQSMSKKSSTILIVGTPLSFVGNTYNCAVVIASGNIVGVVPKTYLPNSEEFYEMRWFTPSYAAPFKEVSLCGKSKIPFGNNLVFQSKNNQFISFGIEICEDLWAVQPPSGNLVAGGASVIFNPSASNELAGKAAYRRDLIKQQSARILGGYVYSSAGVSESTTDTVFGGDAIICENGRLLVESPRFQRTQELTIADIDAGFLIHERGRSGSFSQYAIYRKSQNLTESRVISFSNKEIAPRNTLLRTISPDPFVPNNPELQEERCEEILAIQSSGLASRLQATGIKKVILGLSGGLDSTLALLVAIEAFKRLELDTKGILSYTLPGFGTTERTKSNAEKLCEELNLPFDTVDIKEACTKQLKDINHSGRPEDTAYENVQARQRTLFLMNKANLEGGLVIGTGDLSELALGWCTYNGDHMSMYAVNTGVPKTLVRHLIDFYAKYRTHKSDSGKRCAEILRDIIATPISPELLPPDKTGKIAQKTEDVLGSYRLHDFFLYQIVRCGFTPKKVLFLAKIAFTGDFTDDEIKKRLILFYKRFFSQQFKRSAIPDGPKVGTISLSPRADWRMPSDASVHMWLNELEKE